MNKLRYYILCVIFLSCFHTGMCDNEIRFTGSEMATEGIFIKDFRSGKIIAEKNGGKLLTPASTMKLVTVAAAMLNGSAKERYVTSISFNGDYNPVDSTFTGMVTVTPSGDPSLNSNNLDVADGFTSFTLSCFKELGIRNFVGEIMIEGENVSQQGQIPTWEIEDASYGYGAGWYAFNFNDNVFRYEIPSGISVPPVPFLTFDYQPTDADFEIIHGVESDIYTFTGNVFGKPRKLTLPLPWPATLYIEELLSGMDRACISYRDSSFSEVNRLPCLKKFEWLSPEKNRIYDRLLKYSDNLMAECTLRDIAPGCTRDSALNVEKSLLMELGVNPKGMRIFDGSGLTRKNGVTPRFLMSVLEKMAGTDMAKEYASFFPVAGKDGTMRSFRFKSSKGRKLALKTGSVNGVRCYAGYLLDSAGLPVAGIVVMLNQFSCAASDVRNAVEKYLIQKISTL